MEIGESSKGKMESDEMERNQCRFGGDKMTQEWKWSERENFFPVIASGWSRVKCGCYSTYPKHDSHPQPGTVFAHHFARSMGVFFTSEEFGRDDPWRVGIQNHLPTRGRDVWRTNHRIQGDDFSGGLGSLGHGNQKRDRESEFHWWTTVRALRILASSASFPGGWRRRVDEGSGALRHAFLAIRRAGTWTVSEAETGKDFQFPQRDFG